MQSLPSPLRSQVPAKDVIPNSAEAGFEESPQQVMAQIETLQTNPPLRSRRGRLCEVSAAWYLLGVSEVQIVGRFCEVAGAESNCVVTVGMNQFAAPPIPWVMSDERSALLSRRGGGS